MKVFSLTGELRLIANTLLEKTKPILVIDDQDSVWSDQSVVRVLSGPKSVGKPPPSGSAD